MFWSHDQDDCHAPCADPDRGQGIRIPLKNHKNIGSLSHTSLDPLKNHKLCSQHSMLGHHRHTRETPFKWHLFRWRADDGPILVIFGSTHLLKKKNWTSSEKTGSAHALICGKNSLKIFISRTRRPMNWGLGM